MVMNELALLLSTYAESDNYIDKYITRDIKHDKRGLFQGLSEVSRKQRQPKVKYYTRYTS